MSMFAATAASMKTSAMSPPAFCISSFEVVVLALSFAVLNPLVRSAMVLAGMAADRRAHCRSVCS